MDRGRERTQFKLTDKTYTTFYNRFFTLRVLVSINGQTAEIGVSDKNILQLSSRYPKTSISFDSLMCLVNEVVCHHGVSGVRHGWCENEAPLFELTIKPGDDFSKLLRTAKQFQTKLAIKVEAMFSKSLATSPPTPLSVDVHTELYMVTPNAANSSIHLVPVASDNLLVCLDLWRESAVFDFGAAFIAYRTEPTLDGDEGFELGHINKELRNVAEWYSLGTNLGLSKDDLDIIRQDVGKEGVMQCRLEMLSLWYNRCASVSWPELISALVLTGRRRLAHKLALKYRVAVPPTLVKTPPTLVRSTSVNEPCTPIPVQEELCGKVEQLRRMLEEKDTELEDKKKIIRESNSKEEALIKQRDLVTFILKQNVVKSIELHKKKKSLEQELKSQGMELKHLESAQHDSKWQSEMIEEKKEMIKQLKERLKSVEADLQSERVISRDLKDKVFRIERELQEKTAEMHGYEMEVLKLKYELSDQRSELDQLNQLRAANSTHKELVQEFQHQLSVVKQVSESKSSEIEQYQADIAQKEAEMQKLLARVQEQLASQQQLSSRLQEERDREVMAETLELQARLSQAEQDKRRAEGELAATQLQITKLNEREKELKRLQLATEQKKLPPSTKPRPKKREKEISSESTSDSLKYIAVFPHSQPTTGTIAQFEVHCTSKPCPVNITAQLTSLVDSSTTDATLDSHTQAISTLSYNPTQRGRHHLNVLVNGDPIANSPFTLYVQYPSQNLGQPVRIIETSGPSFRVVITKDEHLVVTGSGRIAIFDKYGKLIREIESIGSRGLAVHDDIMFISDGVSHELIKMSSDGKLLNIIGGRGTGIGQFQCPTGITLISNKIFVCDYGNDRVQMFDTDLNVLGSFGTAGSGDGNFHGPMDIASDQDGCLYVVDSGNNRVQVFSPNGKYLQSIGKHGHGPNKLCGPHGIHFHNGKIYITEYHYHNKRVSVFTKSGLFVTSFGMEMEVGPQGIAVDENGYIYMCDGTHPGHIYVY